MPAMSAVSPLVLGIETSCDDTACALVDGAGRVLASVVSSQLAAHRPYGGVVPEIASREHLANWPAVSAEALAEAGLAHRRGRRRRGDARARADRLAPRRALARSRARLGARPAVPRRPPSRGAPLLALPAPAGEPGRGAPERFVALVVSGGHTRSTASTAPRSRRSPRRATTPSARRSTSSASGSACPIRRGRWSTGWRSSATRGAAAAAPRRRLAGTEELFFSYSGLKTAGGPSRSRSSRRRASRGASPRGVADEPHGAAAAGRSTCWPASATRRCGRCSTG